MRWFGLSFFVGSRAEFWVREDNIDAVMDNGSTHYMTHTRDTTDLTVKQQLRTAWLIEIVDEPPIMKASASS